MTLDLETRIRIAPDDATLDELLHELAAFQDEAEQQRLIDAVAARRALLRDLEALHDPSQKATVPMQRPRSET